MTLHRYAWLLLAVSMLALLTAAACGGGEKATPTARVSTPAPRPTAAPTQRPAATATPAGPVGKLVAAVSSFGNESLDPSFERTVGTGTIGAPIFDWLAWHTPNGELTKGVAERWEMAADAKTWTYTLRDMAFHNGDRVTADDVKFSIERILRPEATSTNAQLWRASIASVDVVSPKEVKVTTKTPWPLMNFAASPREGPEGVVLPKAYFERIGDKEFREKAVGTGPWKLVRHEGGVKYVYEAVTAKHPYRETPAYKELEITLVPEEATRVANLKTGAAQLAEITPESQKTLLDSNMQVLSIDNTTNSGAHFFGAFDERTQGKPLGNKEVRKALTLAVNRQEIIDTILGGKAALPARFIVVPGTLGYDPAWKPDPYDVASAKKILADAGYANGFSLKFLSLPIPGAVFLPRAVEAIAGYWSQIGIKTEIIQTDFGAFTGYYRTRPQPEQLIGNVGVMIAPVIPTNLPWFRTYYRSGGVLLLHPSPDMDKLIDAAFAAIDPQEQVKGIRQVVDLAYSNYVSIPLATTPALYGASKDLVSWNPIASSYLGMALETVRPRR